MGLIYRSELAEVYHADARDVLPSKATESVDLIVTDPPYGAEWQSNHRAERFDLLEGDLDTAGDRDGIRTVLAECVRLVGQHRHLYVFGPVDVLDGLKISEAVCLIWHKDRPGMGDLTASWGPAHEDITFTTSKHRHAGKTGAPSIPARIRKGSVLTFPAPTGRNVRHPSEKPVGLLRELIESSSRQGETVLDPFAGTGSTAVAAILTGRRAIVIEVNQTYATIAAERCAAAEANYKQARTL